MLRGEARLSYVAARRLSLVPVGPQAATRYGQSRTPVRNLNLILERGTGFEPATSTLGRLSSRDRVITRFHAILAC